MAGIEHKQQRIAGIDGLRAIAVVAVIIYHVYPRALPGGFVGVDVFFAISGYVVCGSLLRDPRDRFLSFIGAFYARRILRIFPALIVLLLATGVLSALFIPGSFLSASNSRIGLFAFFGSSNIAMILFTDGYFSPTAEFNPFTHTWSLGLEEQFYVLFPIILFFYLRADQRGNLGQAIGRTLLPLLLGLSLLLSMRETVVRHEYAYYLLPSRFWELGAGTLLCLAHQKGRLLPASSGRAATFVTVGLITIVLSTIFATPGHFPFPWAIAPVLGTVLCIAGVVAPCAGCLCTKILTFFPSVYIGRISYSAYLWHWPVIVLFRWTIGMESAIAITLAPVIGLLLSMASYHSIELPIQLRSAVFKSHRKAVIIGGASLIMLSSITYILVVLSQKHIGLSVVTKNPDIWTMKSLKANSLLPGAEGKPWSGKNLFVIGDSHASAYREMFQMLMREKGGSIYLNSKGGGSLGSLMRPLDQGELRREQEALDDLRRYCRPGDVVFLASLRVLDVGSQWGDIDLQDVIKQRDSPEAEAQRAVAVREGEELIGRLERMGLRVIIDAPKPVFMAPPFRCSDWFNKNNPVGRKGFVMDRDFLLTHRSAAMRSIHEVQKQHSEVRIWDPLLILCKGAQCCAFEGPNPLFFDGDHLSNYGNHKLYPSFEAELERIWGDQGGFR